jgi:spore germination protein GerM
MRIAWLLTVLNLAVVFAVVSACSGGEGDVDRTQSIVLVFPETTATEFDYIPVLRDVPANEARPEAVLEALLDGPTAAEEADLGVFNPFPSGVRILSIERAGSTATVDFSAELLDYPSGAANVEAISVSITRTVESLYPVSRVIILVGGEPDQLQP